MQNHNRGATRRRTRALGLAMLCGAAFAGAPALANPSFTYRTIAVTDINNTVGAFASLGLASINDAGAVAFYGSTFCTGATCSGIFTVDPAGTLTRVIDGGNPALGYPYQTFGDAIINHGGAVSFSVANFTSSNAASSVWIDLWKAGLVRQLIPAHATSVPPGLYPIINPRLFNNSRVVYAETDTGTLMLAIKGTPPQPAAPGYCTFTNATGSSLNGWIVTAGGPTGGACTNAGYLATNLPAATTTLRIPNDGTYGALGPATVNASGTVAFVAKNLPGRTNVEGFFQQKVGSIAQKLAEIDNGSCANTPPPSGSCQYRGYVNSLAINPKGQALTVVGISTWTAGNPNPSTTGGVALNGDAVNGQVAWPGMVIDGCDVVGANTGPRAINKYGQIVMLLNCRPRPGTVKGYLALVVATPPVQ